MAVMRLRALQQLADRIANCVPELKGKICGGAAEAPKRLGFPSLGIFAVSFRFFPDQQAFHKSLGVSSAVFNVGRVEGTVQLRLGAQTAQRRYELEQKIMEQVFWADIERPGVVVLTVPDCHDAVIAYELDEGEWEDERAFDKKWYSITTCALQMPALVKQDSCFTIDDLRLTFTEDLTTAIVSVPTDQKETHQIGSDGSLTPVASP